MKAFLFIISFLIVLTTVIVCIKPQVHKTTNIVYTDFAIVNRSNEEIRKVNVVNNNVNTNKTVTTVNPTQTNVETRTINTITQTQQPQTVTTTTQNIQPQVVTTTTHSLQPQTVTTTQQKTLSQPVKTETVTQHKTTTQPQTQQVAKQQVQQVTKTVPTTVAQQTKTQEKKVETKKTTQTTTAQNTKTQPSTATTTKTAQNTIQRREIDWEPWRIKIGKTLFANLYQQLETTVPAGTQYEYSFDVDNNKKVNVPSIRVVVKSSPDKARASKGVQIIILGIMNLSGKSVLTYPTGADGVTTAPMKAIITVREG